ncbi:alpha/beta hydrolase [Vandammella animalimorsus]|uniref:Acyl-CoA:diacylglycerol acyltransferase n=1 Tax=Vandammella animalimorsus TaxID=2029117 RepID=A0A2A2AZS1_9BURK|nr:alpha/beta hydrolase-fold protein [Vandammella animalimorsus]PAT43231.1 esterase [Vandammella animalimorsus]
MPNSPLATALPFTASRRAALRIGLGLGSGLALSGCAGPRPPMSSASPLPSPHPLADLPMHPARIDGAGWFDWEDHASGQRWRIWLQMPEQPAPPEGYPALVVLDGNAIFPLAAQWARLQQTRPVYVRGQPSVIIGIGHPGDALFDATSRRRDYTPPAPGVQAPEGGADRLLDFLEHVLLADWAQRLPLNRQRLGLFGHSLSGLFVLHALFTRPALFGQYYAASPSIWWHDAYLLQEQARFTQRHASQYGGAQPSGQAQVFLYAGSLEEPSAQGRPAHAPPTGQRHTVRLQITRAREMAQQLAALRWPGLQAQFQLWPDLTHGDTMMPSLMQAVANTSRPAQWKDADYGLQPPQASGGTGR